jgi:hypothetical protein
MSSNVPTNEQNAAVVSGSDNESVSSVSSQVANLNLERSSSPPVPSSEPSDEEGDTTITKDAPGNDSEDLDEEGQIPFLSKYGEVSASSQESVWICQFSIFLIPDTRTPLFGYC